MGLIAELLFFTLAFVIGGSIIIGLLIAVDERKKSRRALNKLDRE